MGWFVMPGPAGDGRNMIWIVKWRVLIIYLPQLKSIHCLFH